MNNEELKKKIVEVIDNWADNAVKTKRSGASVYDPYNAAELADALIAAGIGDVRTAQEIGASATAMAVLEAAKAEHRAARAERALDLCETAYILSLNHRATEGISGQAIASDFGIHKFFMKQAEKELTEEGKE